MKKLILVLMAILSFSVSAIYAIEDSNVVAPLRAYTLKNKTETNFFNGTAILIDAKEYGCEGDGYVITASHVVLDTDGKPKLKFEIKVNDVWEDCKLIKYDIDYDIAVLKCEIPLRGIKIKNEYKEEEVTSISFPMNKYKVSKGKISVHSYHQNKARWISDNYIDHGSSGGAIVSKSKGETELVGLITDGLCLNGSHEMTHKGTIFLPSKYIIEFLKGGE